MTTVTLTEAITDLAFGRADDAASLLVRERADFEGWTARYRELAISAHQAVAAIGRDLNFFRVKQNPLTTPSVIPPSEVDALFAACAARENYKAAEGRAMAAASKLLLTAAEVPEFEIYGKYEGRGKSKAIPHHEIRHLAVFTEFGYDNLVDRHNFETWTHVTADAAPFRTWLEAERRRSLSRNKSEVAIGILEAALSSQHGLTAAGAHSILKDEHKILVPLEILKRDLLPEARRRRGLPPRGAGRPRKSTPKIGEEK